jgi:hypothetical protein
LDYKWDEWANVRMGQLSPLINIKIRFLNIPWGVDHQIISLPLLILQFLKISSYFSLVVEKLDGMVLILLLVWLALLWSIIIFGHYGLGLNSFKNVLNFRVVYLICLLNRRLWLRTSPLFVRRPVHCRFGARTLYSFIRGTTTFVLSWSRFP